ncbi:hypothetical protein C3B55_00833 [Candidatus Pseudomonas adelgestsugas]|uniref:Uncharacterized protein n=1 Tax=Candidatus Pseudomonas adelgestsugas TaxID=1302376 RepID=A0ABX5R9C1_9PSED|nr:hypothetical protein C3B55_00833 [Candidatus Pseudomonas adelgestsugas]
MKQPLIYVVSCLRKSAKLIDVNIVIQMLAVAQPKKATL